MARRAVVTPLLMLVLLLGLACVALADLAQADAPDFTLDTTDAVPGMGGAAFADSADFLLDTTDTAPGIGGIAIADSADFTLDTTDTVPGVGGVAHADSADFVLNTLAAGEGESAEFTLDTTDTVPGTGGVAMADSADFTLDTTDTVPGIGGVAYADSADFTLNTIDIPPGSGGFVHADSADFILDTTDPGPGDVEALDAGIVGIEVMATAVQPDGKTIIAGNFTSALGVPRGNIARLNADGTLDLGFDPKADSTVWCVAVQADGKVLLGGTFTTLQPNGAGVPTARQNIARVNPDGTLDTGFDPKANNGVVSVAAQADGKVLLGGYFTALQPNGAGAATARPYIARVNSDGTLDTGFDPRANGVVFSVTIQPDGKVLLGGDFTTLHPNGAGAGSTRLRIARVDSAGTLDTGFDPRANASVNSVAVQEDGKVLLGGYFTTLQPNGAVSATTRNNIARVNIDGTLDAGFDPKANGAVLGMAVQTDGNVLVGGLFTTLQPNGAVTATPRNYVARVNPDGTLDAGFDPRADNSVYGMALQADGRVLLGGTFTTLQPNGEGAPIARNRFARLVNGPVTQSLTVPGAGRVQWLRGGASPESQQVSFELSTDGGTLYTALGAGTRISGGWERTGLSLPSSGHIRARARTSAGIYNGTGGLVQSVAAFSVSLTPIEIWRQLYFGSPANIGNGADTFDFDGDGFVNLIEFAFGMNPTQANGSSALPTVTLSGGNFAASFTQPVGVGGITYGAEWSTTLLPGSWTAIPDTGIAPQHIFTMPVGSEPRMFMRFTVTNP